MSIAHEGMDDMMEHAAVGECGGASITCIDATSVLTQERQLHGPALLTETPQPLPEPSPRG
jgi:hypothetical protein